jgi:hypothetical protein
MTFESKALDQLTEKDIRDLISIGRREGATLEYKEVYKQDERGKKEFLLDVCMFGNSGGGDILIGVPEMRDADGQPTGFPNPEAELGIELQNPEQQLLSLESQILDSIDERLPVRLRAVPYGDRHVIVVRVPNSLGKPHRVHYLGRVYFPARRERRRYELTAREIKDLAMRTANQSEKAEAIVDAAVKETTWADKSPLLMAAILPVFWTNFCVDLQSTKIRDSFAQLSIRGEHEEYLPQVGYSLEGLAKQAHRNIWLTLGHNGLLRMRGPFPSGFNEMNDMSTFIPTGIDSFIRRLAVGAGRLFAMSGLGPPAVLKVSLYARNKFYPKYSDWEDPSVFPPRDYLFPVVALTSLNQGVEMQLKPLFDHIHQAFGRAGSPSFDMDGNWMAK